MATRVDRRARKSRRPSSAAAQPEARKCGKFCWFCDKDGERAERIERIIESGMVFFLIAFVWHVRVFPNIFNIGGRNVMARIALFPEDLDLFRDQHGLKTSQESREFALTAAISHTLVYFLGCLAAFLLPKTRTPMNKKGVALFIVMALWITAVFHKIASAGLKYCFRHGVFPVRHFAQVFFETSKLEKGVVSPFIWTSSVSFSSALMFGLISSFVHAHFNLFTFRTFHHLGFPLIIYMLVLENVVLPLIDMKSANIERRVMVFACLGGMALCCLVSLYATVGLRNRKRVTQDYILSTAFALILLSLSLFESAVRIYVFGVLIFIFGQWKELRVSLLRLKKDLATFLLVSFLWNCHLLAFWSSFLPFHMYAWIYGDELNYKQTEAFFDGWCFVLFGSYGFPVCFKAILKIYLARMKRDWDFLHDIVIGGALIVPLSSVLASFWIYEKAGFPILCILTIIHVLYLTFTWRGRPEISGCRGWDEMRAWNLWDLISYFFDQRIVVEGVDQSGRVNWSKNARNPSASEKELEEALPRIMGFHPHGIFPCSLVWFSLTSKWREIFGDLMPRPLTDAFIHAIPVMREFNQWAGGLEVNRMVVEQCLKRKETIMMVPGGQAEILLHSSENLEAKKIVLSGRHKGFIRLALKYGAELVPSFSFGELQAMQNISFPPMQRFTRRVLGFPLPFFPVGLLGLLPVPSPVQMTYAVGEPIATKCATPGCPTSAEIDRFHALYFQKLEALFEKHKDAAGYGDWTIETLSEHD